jgi:hypothetical protein
MKTHRRSVVRLLALLLGAPLVLLAANLLRGHAAGANGEQQTVATSLTDQEEVSVTVYNSNLGLVKDVRKISLPGGLMGLRFGEVAAQIMPQTVHMKSLTDPARFQILEQNYEYDLLTPQKLLEKFTGKEITILKDGVEVPITVLSTNQGVVYRLGGRIFTGHPGNLIFPTIPENLISQPTLVWLLQNRQSGPQKVEATYLTRGINWRADYVAVFR